MDDQLLFRDIKDQTSTTERSAVDAWRRSLPVHEARYQELRNVLAAMTPRRVLRTTPPPVLDVLRVAAQRERDRSRHTLVRRTIWASIGVAALLLVGVGLDRRGTKAEFGFEEMVTGDTQPVTVSLRDGSVMRLAPRSRARIRVRDGIREVHLVGRAYFAVAKRDGQPFVVKTQGGDVTVLGTQFDLDARDANVRVLVLEGKVSLSAARGGEVKITRGQVARIVEGQLQPTETIAAPMNETRWVGRFLAFRDTPLSEVAKELGRAYGANVTIADSTLVAHTVTDWFSDRPLDEVVRVLCTIVATECEVKGLEITIGKAAR